MNILNPSGRSAVSPAIKWLTVLAIASLVVVVGLKLFFDSLQDELSARSANERARLFVGEEIVRGIGGVEKDLYLLAVSSNPGAVRRIKRSIDTQLVKLRHDLNVLNEGGSVKREVLLNIEGRDEMVREATYSPTGNADRYVMEVIEIGPLLDEVNVKTAGLEALLMKGWQFQEDGDSKGFFAWHDEIDAYLKFLPPYFARLNENASRLFFDSSERLRELEAELEIQRARLKKIELAVLGAVVILAGLGALGFAQHIDHANQRLQEAMEEMRRAKDEAERASRAKSDFVSRMSHELRTPLNAIIGFAELLGDEPLSPSHKGYVKLINDSGKHLMGLINEVLDHAKIEAGGLTLEKIPFDFHAAIDAVKTIVNDRATAKGLNFIASISDQLPRYIFGDPTRLRQVLLNLLVNAVKFTERGSVELRIAPEDGRIYFSIRDTGIGMDAAAQARLFKPFSQADDSVTRKYGGTGLGLVISRELIQAMGGDIEVESAPQVGTVFWFWLPLREAIGPVAEPVAPPSAVTMPTTSGRILVVDDNRVNLQLAAAMLDRLGLAHEEVQSGRQALDRLAGNDFVLVLMDMEMPEMDGITATQVLRTREAASGSARMPVVAMTANALQEDRERCFAAGMDGYIAKPINLTALQDELRRLLAPTPAELMVTNQSPASAIVSTPPAITAMAPPAMPDHLFDRAAAVALMGDEELFDDIAIIFSGDAPTYLTELDSALATADTPRLVRAAHTLKGLFGTFAAPDCEAAARELELAGKAGDLAACAPLAARVRELTEALIAALKDSTRRHQTPNPPSA